MSCGAPSWRETEAYPKSSCVNLIGTGVGQASLKKVVESGLRVFDLRMRLPNGPEKEERLAQHKDPMAIMRTGIVSAGSVVLVSFGRLIRQTF